jgi:hypothetical protein
VRDTGKELGADRNRDTALSGQTVNHPVHLKKASRLIGMDVNDATGSEIAEVKDFVVDLHSGRVVAAILGSGGIIGVGQTLHAVPPGQLKPSADDKGELTAVFSKDKLDKSPKFTVNMWPNIGDSKWATDVYGYYQERTYWDSTRQPVRDRLDQPTDPLRPELKPAQPAEPAPDLAPDRTPQTPKPETPAPQTPTPAPEKPNTPQQPNP